VCRLCRALAGDSFAKPVNAHRPGDVLDLLLAQILEGEIQLVALLIAHDTADTDPAGLG